MIGRAVAGIALALAIALLARRARALDTGGAIAAVVVGTASMAAGWAWGALLLLFFGTGTALSRWRRTERERRTGSVIAKGGARDAAQVLANGGLYAAITLGVARWVPAPAAAHLWAGAAAGAVAAATADTWATEIGSLVGGTPRSLRTGRPVAPGTSGAVSVAGTLAMIAGAATIAAAAWRLGLPQAAVLGALLGGIAGATADTLLGASLQERRWCPRCAAGTERALHDCGTPTTLVGGLSAIGNDAVNACCSAVGALAGAAAGSLAGGTG